MHPNVLPAILEFLQTMFNSADIVDVCISPVKSNVRALDRFSTELPVETDA